jgi:hypothetical protein
MEKKKQRGVFLMATFFLLMTIAVSLKQVQQADPIYVTDALIAEDIDAYLPAPAQDHAALHHLRLGGRRQIDADRAAAV